MKRPISLVVYGEQHDVLCAPNVTLLEVLREQLGLTGTKHGCELGECGACVVLLDETPVLSCLLLAMECEGRAITTVEGLKRGSELSPLQAAFADAGASQCGYCTPGMLLSATALLAKQATPSRADIHTALSGNLCRCTGYHQIVEAVESVAAKNTADSHGSSAR